MYDFALRLHDLLPADGNLVWSPYSVASALGLAALGARGATYDELERALGAAPGALRLAEAAELPEAEIAVANALWLCQGLSPREDYQRHLMDLPGAAMHVADFAHDAEGARRAINADVAKTTRELIKELLPPGAVDSYTSSVIVNALYLKAAWRKVFGKRDTVGTPFHGSGGRRRVPMMRQTEWMPYAEAHGWRMVTLHAVGGLAVDVLVGESTAAPSAARLRELHAAARGTKVALTLPPFRVESQASLRAPLEAMGVMTAFSDVADFSGIAHDRFQISRVEHKAVLDVAEEGFEGAAATAVVFMAMGLDFSEPLEFRVDRPFLMIVRHPATEAVYFLARVTDPA